MLVVGDFGTRDLCTKSREAARDCETRPSNNNARKKSNENCDLHRVNARKCVKALQNAFNDINMGGCPKQIKLLTLCEDEWCRQPNPTACSQECDRVRKTLSQCVHEKVMHYINMAGFEEISLTNDWYS